MSASVREPLLAGNGTDTTTLEAPGQLMGPARRASPGQQQQQLGAEEDPTCWDSCCSCCGAARGPPAPAPPAPLMGEVKAAPSLLALDLASPEGAAFAHLAGGLWVSHVLKGLWPNVSAMVEAMVQDTVPALLEASTPKWMEGVSLDKFELGNRPPTVLNAHVDQTDDDDVAEVRLHLEVEWTSQSDIQLTIKPLPAMVSQMIPTVLQAMVQFMTSLSVGIQGLSVRAQVLLTLAPLSDEAPVVKALHISMLRSPAIDYNITLTKGESTILNVVKPWLRSIIASCFTMYVLPEIIHVPIAPGQLPVHKPEGVVLVQVVRATDVPKMDYWGHSDTYCDVSVRSRIRRRTPIVKKSANPEWPAADATFTLLVHARQYQTLLLELWDSDEGVLDNTDDAVGYCTLSLSSLHPGKAYALTLPVLNASSKFVDLDAPLEVHKVDQWDLSPAMAGPLSDLNATTTTTTTTTSTTTTTTTTAAATTTAAQAPAQPEETVPLLQQQQQAPPRSSTPEPTRTPRVDASTSKLQQEVVPHMARHGIDPTHACARSTADVSNTALHLVVRYVPAYLAHLLADEVGAPGVLNMKLSKVTVPDLALLPLRGRAYITGQRPAVNVPLSYVLRPQRGKDKVTGEDLAERKDIPFWYDVVWDVLGSASEVAACTFVLELVDAINTVNERVVARVDMPVGYVMARRITTMVGGVAGGDYTLKSDNGFVFDMQLLWAPLLIDGLGSAAKTPEAPPGLQHSATTPANSTTNLAAAAVAAASGGSGSGGLTASASMPAELHKDTNLE